MGRLAQLGLKILDCTLRDGGYYTGWNFDRDITERLVTSLDEAKVDIIELGYKSRLEGGIFRRCEEKDLAYLPKLEHSKYCFMIDLKDFSSYHEITQIDALVPDEKCSIFSWCRVATRYKDIETAAKVCFLLKRKGYNVALNVMCISQLTSKELRVVQDAFSCRSYADVLYLADSYGSLSTAGLTEIMNDFGKYSPMGLHLHDNLGTSLATAIQSLSTPNIRYIDGTIAGMGRGVGNLRLEQFLPLVKSLRPDTDIAYLEHTIHDFESLKQKYDWGWSQAYQLSGLNDIHPFYCMKLKQRGFDDFTSCKILSRVDERKVSFDPAYLQELIDCNNKKEVAVIIPARFESTRFPGKPLVKINGTRMIIRVAELVSKAVGKENVYIATDSEEIREHVEERKFNVILTSKNCMTGTDRVAEAAKKINASTIISVQGDEPLLEPGLITRVLAAKTQFPGHVINCASKLDPNNQTPSDPKMPKMVLNNENELLYASRSPIPGNKKGIINDNVGTLLTMKQVCVYAFTNIQLERYASIMSKTRLEAQEDIEILRFLELGIPVKVVIEENVFTHAVDYPEDIPIVEGILNARL